MGQPQWTAHEIAYFRNEIVPYSEFTTGRQVKGSGDSWHTLAGQMREHFNAHPTQRPARRSYNGDMLYQWFWRNMKKDLRSGALVIQARKRAQPIGEDAVKKNVTKDLADDDSISIDSDSTGGVDITPVPAPAAKPRAPSSARSEGLFVRQSIEDNPESLNQLHQAGVSAQQRRRRLQRRVPEQTVSSFSRTRQSQGVVTPSTSTNNLARDTVDTSPLKRRSTNDESQDDLLRSASKRAKLHTDYKGSFSSIDETYSEHDQEGGPMLDINEHRRLTYAKISRSYTTPDLDAIYNSFPLPPTGLDSHQRSRQNSFAPSLTGLEQYQYSPQASAADLETQISPHGTSEYHHALVKNYNSMVYGEAEFHGERPDAFRRATVDSQLSGASSLAGGDHFAHEQGDYSSRINSQHGQEFQEYHIGGALGNTKQHVPVHLQEPFHGMQTATRASPNEMIPYDDAHQISNASRLSDPFGGYDMAASNNPNDVRGPPTDSWPLSSATPFQHGLSRSAATTQGLNDYRESNEYNYATDSQSGTPPALSQRSLTRAAATTQGLSDMNIKRSSDSYSTRLGYATMNGLAQNPFIPGEFAPKASWNGRDHQAPPGPPRVTVAADVPVQERPTAHERPSRISVFQKGMRSFANLKEQTMYNLKEHSRTTGNFRQRSPLDTFDTPDPVNAAQQANANIYSQPLRETPGHFWTMKKPVDRNASAANLPLSNKNDLALPMKELAADSKTMRRVALSKKDSNRNLKPATGEKGMSRSTTVPNFMLNLFGKGKSKAAIAADEDDNEDTIMKSPTPTPTPRKSTRGGAVSKTNNTSPKKRTTTKSPKKSSSRLAKSEASTSRISKSDISAPRGISRSGKSTSRANVLKLVEEPTQDARPRALRARTAPAFVGGESMMESFEHDETTSVPRLRSQKKGVSFEPLQESSSRS